MEKVLAVQLQLHRARCEESMLLYEVTMFIDASPLFRSLVAVEKRDLLSLDVLNQKTCLTEI